MSNFTEEADLQKSLETIRFIILSDLDAENDEDLSLLENLELDLEQYFDFDYDTSAKNLLKELADYKENLLLNGDEEASDVVPLFSNSFLSQCHLKKNAQENTQTIEGDYEAATDFDNITAFIDLGSNKVKGLLLGETNENNQILSITETESLGFGPSGVTNCVDARNTISNLISQLEQLAIQQGHHYHPVNVMVGISVANSHLFTEKTSENLKGDKFSFSDQIRMEEQCKSKIKKQALENFSDVNLDFIQSDIVGYSVGIGKGHPIKNPIGIKTDIIEMKLNAVMTNKTVLENIFDCFESADLNVIGLLSSGFASLYSCTTYQQREMGGLIINIGEHTTNVIAYADNNILYHNVFPFGGNNISTDLARLLAIDHSSAERIKCSYKFKAHSKYQSERMRTTPRSKRICDYSDEDWNMVSFAIQATLFDQFDEIRNQLLSRFSDERFEIICSRIIFTGGGTKLTGFIEMAQEFFSRSSIDIPAPAKQSITKAKPLENPQLSALKGLMRYYTENSDRIRHLTASAIEDKSSFLQWVQKKLAFTNQ